MYVFLILFGLLCISAGQWSLKRGRGGKRTTNGFITLLLGLITFSSGLIGLVGQTGFFLLLILFVLYRTPLTPWIIRKIKDLQKRFTDRSQKTYYSSTTQELITTKGENPINSIDQEVLELNAKDESLFYNNQDNLSETSINQVLIPERDDALHFSDNSPKKHSIEAQENISREREVSVCLQINYEDIEGNYTDRQVRVISFNNKNLTGSFYAYCYLRRDYRTFRFDRVINCINKDTGEVIPDVKYYLNKLYEDSPKKNEDELLEKYLYVMEILYYVAKVDGQFRKKEKDIIFNYMERLINRNDIDTSKIEDLFKKIKIPSLNEYQYAWKNACERREIDLNQLKQCCHSIVNTQKKITAEEKQALDVIDSIINKNKYS